MFYRFVNWRAIGTTGIIINANKYEEIQIAIGVLASKYYTCINLAVN